RETSPCCWPVPPGCPACRDNPGRGPETPPLSRPSVSRSAPSAACRRPAAPTPSSPARTVAASEAPRRAEADGSRLDVGDKEAPRANNAGRAAADDATFIADIVDKEVVEPLLVTDTRMEIHRRIRVVLQAVGLLPHKLTMAGSHVGQ